MSDTAKALQQDVAPEFVSERSGLSYVTGRYTKQRLNELFGPLGWSFEVLDVRLDRDNMSAFVHGRLTVTIHQKDAEPVTVTKDGLALGFASGRSNNEAFDFAIAEGVTDPLKRAAVGLGQNLGLCLYPLTAGGAQKKKAAPKKTKAAKPAAKKPAPKAAPVTETADDEGDDW
jgi:recombination DNA repair RAD52 pathway protein